MSIKMAFKEAGEGHVGSFLALTDSIIGVIKCCPTSIARDQSEKEALDKVNKMCMHALDTVYMYINCIQVQAKELLRRIEERDLYHCSGKVRIPKKWPTKQEVEHDCVAKTRRDSEHNGGSLWRALMTMSRQPLSQGESIHEFLEAEKQETIKISDLWVSVCLYYNYMYINYTLELRAIQSHN